MDSWLKFQHLMISELWGHKQRAQAGNEKTGTSEVRDRKANPPVNLKT